MSDVEATAGLAEDPPKAQMTFVEHLTELRDRMVRAAFAVFLGFMVAFAYREPLFAFVAAPIQEALAAHGIYNLRAIEITETIFVYLKLAVVAGIVATLPYSFFHMWAFVAPGLLEKEKRAIAPLIFFSTFFFLLGCWFAYEVIIPFVASYLAELTIIDESIAMDVTVQSAFSFSLKLLIAFGVAFELPLVMFFLCFLGLVDAKKYVAVFRYFVVVSFIIAAVFTPPDPISQLLMAVPLNLLYWVGVAAAYSIERKDRDGEGMTRRSLSIPSRVWGFLSVTLFLVGGGIALGTWWLGQSRSPFGHVPSDAVWVASVRVETTLGPAAPDARVQRLVTALALPTGSKTPQRAIVAQGPDGQRLVVFVDGCEDGAPNEGRCVGGDLLQGDLGWADTASSAGDLADDPTIRSLGTTAPAWVWERTPDASRLALLPGAREAGIDLESFVFATDLRPESPWVEVRVRPKDAAHLTALQNRVDLWRAEIARRDDDAAGAREAARSHAELLGLLEELVALSDRRFGLVRAAANDPKALGEVEKLDAALRTRLKGRLDALKGAVTPAVEDHSLLARLGPEAITSWRTAIDDETLALRVELKAPNGIEAALRLIRLGGQLEGGAQSAGDHPEDPASDGGRQVEQVVKVLALD